MRNRIYFIIYILATTCLFISVIPVVKFYVEGEENIPHLKTSALTEINSTILINDTPGSLVNWSWAKAQGYCTGSGTMGDPYIISDFFFNTTAFSENSLSIRHSSKYFVITDCEFKTNFDYAAILLHNTTNGHITNNMMYPNAGALVWIYNASYNLVYNNNASAGYYYGILIDGSTGISQMNDVYGNLFDSNQEAGIQFRAIGSQFNLIRDNDFLLNPLGIEISAFSRNNTIKGNRIRNSTIAGVVARTNSESNIIHENCFYDNAFHAVDDGLFNSWDDGIRGNYWDNYTGSDADNDGIGDAPYNISGSALNQDNYPLMNCPISGAGEIPGYDIYLILLIGIGSIFTIIMNHRKRKLK